MNKVVKPCLKAWRFLDEALAFATKSDLKIDEAEIIRTNSTGLALFNPENASAMLKSMKNQKPKTREDKIKERIAYETGIQKQSDIALN